MQLWIHFQTVGATDFEFFSIDGTYFLAVANAFDYGNTSSQPTTSTIYKLNLFYKKFEIYQNITTYK